MPEFSAAPASIEGLHHVTATVDEAGADLRFYTRLLGLRLVKKTVNFDDPTVYHFYYGDRRGTPGTLMTTFPYRGKGVHRGLHGAGQVTATAFSVAPEALPFWRDRLAAHGLAVREPGRRFGEEVLVFDDPSGLVLELTPAGGDARSGWPVGDIHPAEAVRGLYGVTLTLRDPGPTRAFLESVLGFEVLGEEHNRIRLGVNGGGAGNVLDVQREPGAPNAVNGLGTVHHVALAVGSGDAQQALQERLRGLGYTVTDVRDRTYFQSIYFREPGGVLIEVATRGPGFTLDEPEAHLGETLKLPDWAEPKRAVIEAALPRV